MAESWSNRFFRSALFVHSVRSMQIDSALSSLANRQHGLITRSQLESSALTRWAWRALIEQGTLIPIADSLCRLVGSAQTAEQRILAAVLGTGVETVASHGSAAFLWGGLQSLPTGPIDVLTRRDSTGYRQRADCVVHRPSDWLDVGTARQRGIRVTNPVRTLVDLGATAPGLLRTAMERMIINGTVTRTGLLRGLSTHGRRGRRGIGPLRAVLNEWSFGDEVPDSVLEARFADLIARRGLPTAVFHHEVQGYILDAAWPQLRVGAEVDGWYKYSQKDQFHRQLQRDALLAASGWRVPHFMWTDVVRRENYVVSVLRRTLQEAGWKPDSLDRPSTP